MVFEFLCGKQFFKQYGKPLCKPLSIAGSKSKKNKNKDVDTQFPIPQSYIRSSSNGIIFH